MDDEILTLIKQRDRMLKRYNKCGDPALFSQFKVLRNDTRNRIMIAKKTFFQDKIFDNKNNPKKLWQSLNQLGATNKSKTKAMCSGLDINGEMIFDKA